jgi:RNA polymerase sigma factor (sigma-70 family)
MNEYEKTFKKVTGYDFQRYYLEYRPKLTWYLASKFTKDVDKAGDFANQAFMQALEKIETYDKEKSKLITWLTKIAINLVIKDWKDNHKYNFISLERDTTDAPSILNILKHDEELDSEIDNKKKAELVYDVIDNLQDKYKKVMVMRELHHMAYKDIADSIKKEVKININKENFILENPEDFFSIDLQNEGNGDLILNFVGENGEEYTRTITPTENVTITRDDISWERSVTDSFILNSQYTRTTGSYITTTNLSTIKSQIKKGRELIIKKVKKKFDHINENGVEKFSF